MGFSPSPSPFVAFLNSLEASHLGTKSAKVPPMRTDNRQPDELRPVRVTRHFTKHAPGSVLIEMGETRVLCTAMIQERVPRWLVGKKRGWVTAEYAMLPSSTPDRKDRDVSRGKLDSRSSEIQRLVGRSLRAVTDLAALGERTIWVDCDVLQADGGTRTAGITGAYVALVDAVRHMMDKGLVAHMPLADSVVAVSAGIVAGAAVLDLDYSEDVAADVDMNVVMTGSGRFIEVQGTGEEATFDDGQLAEMLALAKKGMAELAAIQSEALAGD